MKKMIIFLCFLWMAFIFYMSSNNGEISHEKSMKIVDLIENVQDKQQETAERELTNENTIEHEDYSEQEDINEQGDSDKELDKNYKLDYIIRKNAHGFLYMVLAVLISSLLFVYNRKGKGAIVYILFFGLFYAVTDEFHQSFVYGRTSLVSDVLVDFIGVIIGVIFFYISHYIVFKNMILRKKKIKE